MKLKVNSDKELTKIYQVLFNSENGKKILEDLKDRFDVYTADENPYYMYLKEGARSVVLFIEKELNKKL